MNSKDILKGIERRKKINYKIINKLTVKFSTATRNQNNIFKVITFIRVKGYYRKSYCFNYYDTNQMYCMCFIVIKLKTMDYLVQAGTTGEKYINTQIHTLYFPGNNAIFIYKMQMKFLFYQGNNMRFKLYIYMCNVNTIQKIEQLDCLNDI